MPKLGLGLGFTKQVKKSGLSPEPDPALSLISFRALKQCDFDFGKSRLFKAPFCLRPRLKAVRLLRRKICYKFSDIV
jgi:hypothetical protein